MIPIDLVMRPCPGCGSTDESHIFAEASFTPERLDRYAFASRKLPEYMHYRLVACQVCDLLYASPAPCEGTLASAYEAAAYDSAAEASYAASTYAELVGRVGERLPDHDGVLDIGAGDGAFLARLAELEWTNLRGVEPSLAPLSIAPAAIRPLIDHDIFRPEQYAPASFSLITCFQTIEHLDDPLQLCQAAYRLLKPGGAFIVVCHNRRSLLARLLRTHSPIFDIEHLQLFSPRSGKFLFTQAGFRRVKLSRISNRYPIHYWLKLFPLPQRVKKSFYEKVRRTSIGGLMITVPAGNMAVVGYR